MGGRTGLGLLDIRTVSQEPGERRRELTSVALPSGAARMPRPPRLHAPGGRYHVILRGNHEGVWAAASELGHSHCSPPHPFNTRASTGSLHPYED